MKNVIVDFVAPNIKYFVAASKQVVCSVCAKWRLCSVCAQWKNSVLLCFFGGSGGMKGTNGLLQRTFIWKCFLIMLRIVCCVNWFIIGYIHFFKGVQKLLMKPYLDDALSRLQLSICLVGGGGGGDNLTWQLISDCQCRNCNRLFTWLSLQYNAWSFKILEAVVMLDT